MDERSIDHRSSTAARRIAALSLGKLTEWLGWLTDGLMPADCDDSARTDQHRTTVQLGLMALSLCSLHALLQPFGGDLGLGLRAGYAGGAALIFTTLWIGKKTGRMRVPIQLVLLYFAGLFSGSAYALGGPVASSLFWLISLPLAALISGGQRRAALWGGVSIAVLGGFWAAEQLGFAFPTLGTSAERSRLWLFSTVMLTGLMLLQVISFDRSRIQAFLTLSHVSDLLRAKRDSAQAADRERTLLVANLNHELRTPLTAILGFTEIAREQADGDPSLASSRAEIDRMQADGQLFLGTLDRALGDAGS